MKRTVAPILLAVSMVISCYNYVFAQDSQNLQSNNQVVTENKSASETVAPLNNSLTTNPVVEVSNVSKNEVAKQAPHLVTPIVEAPKRILKPANRKVDLHAIIFDPNVVIKEPENAGEMTKKEVAEYKIDKALHGQVSAASTKGLLEDTMKMTFTKGPIESLAPWIDYSGYWSGAWTGDTYKNSNYNVNFNDFGINGKFRTKDDPASGKKTVFRIMFNTGKEVVGNTYMQSFLADNYILRYWTKDDQILIGNARASIGVEGGESPFTLPFFARSQISRTYGNVRDLGIKAQGVHKLYDYSLGFASSERFFKDFFPGPEFTGFVSVKPLGLTDGKYGKLTMGGSIHSGNSESHYCVEGAHLIYEYKRLKASFEYANADGSNGSTGFTPNQSEGYYGTLAYTITPRLQAVARYDAFDPDKNKANDRRTEYTAGLNYYVHGQALKLMLNYIYYTVENGTYGSKILLGTQIIL